MTTIRHPQLVLDAKAELGEAPCWDPAALRLIWVDITQGVVHRFDPREDTDEAVGVGQPVGAAVPTVSGRLALAIRDGFALLDPTTRRIELLAGIRSNGPETMINDGKCDPAGRFWAGTKDRDGRRPLGALYRLDPDGTVIRVLRGVTVSNGLGWSPDRRTMYHIDSATFGIDAFDFEPGSGSVSNRRRLAELPEAWGLPDGMTVDEEGFLWVAFWEGSAVRRLAPDGRLVSVVEMPVSLVTSCAFGGDDLADLYVTSARGGLPEGRERAEPSAGGLFRLRPGVRGLPQRPFAA